VFVITKCLYNRVSFCCQICLIRIIAWASKTSSKRHENEIPRGVNFTCHFYRTLFQKGRSLHIYKCILRAFVKRSSFTEQLLYISVKSISGRNTLNIIWKGRHRTASNMFWTSTAIWYIESCGETKYFNDRQ